MNNNIPLFAAVIGGTGKALAIVPLPSFSGLLLVAVYAATSALVGYLVKRFLDRFCRNFKIN